MFSAGVVTCASTFHFTIKDRNIKDLLKQIAHGSPEYRRRKAREKAIAEMDTAPLPKPKVKGFDL